MLIFCVVIFGYGKEVCFLGEMSFLWWIGCCVVSCCCG